MNSTLKTLAPLLGAGLLAACATVPPLPQNELERTAVTLKTAEELGAQNVPKANYLLQLASEEHAKALRMSQRHEPGASAMLARAQADGDLALEIIHHSVALSQHQAALTELNKTKLHEE